jgi:transposase InsO family protein
VGCRFHLLLDVVGLVLHRVRHRRLRKTDPGWSVATTMASQLVLDAVEQAIWTRGREGRDLAGLIAHHDHGVQYLSVAYSEHLATAGIKPSTGAVGSSYDNARDRHRRMGRLVQPPPALRVLRRPHTGRSRAGSLRSPPDPGNRRSLKLESLRTLRGGSAVARLDTSSACGVPLRSPADWPAYWGPCYFNRRPRSAWRSSPP